MVQVAQIHIAPICLLLVIASSCFAKQDLAVGFEAADVDRSGDVSAKEMKSYLSARIQDEDLEYDKIFAQMDSDSSGQISEDEFKKRHAAIEQVVGSDRGKDFCDPGKDYVLWKGHGHSTNDSKIMAAVIHRFEDLVKRDSVDWPEHLDLSNVPTSLKGKLPFNKSLMNLPTTDDLLRATVIMCGGSGMGFFTSGGVLVSEDGLVLTNYHVAEYMSEGRMAAMSTDGKCHPVVEFLAGNQDRDVALVRIKGEGFTHVNIASEQIPIGGNLEMIHHSENRFFTYDRGYVMRYPVLGSHPWMEISADYAPGASGCGIFNKKRELVGLVSIIQYGDGPALAAELDMSSDDFSDAESDEAAQEGEEMRSMDAMLLVKHAVPLSAIRNLWNPDDLPKKKKNRRMRKAVRELESTDAH